MIKLEEMSILIVDDMKSMRLTIRKMLQNLGIGKTLRFAENGRDAITTMEQSHFDLAILDWNMPVMNGFEVLEKIRQDRALRDLPVIMVTAEAERDIVSEAAESEIDGYLLKPLTLAALDEKIRSVLEKTNHPDEVTVHRMKARELEESGDVNGAINQIRLALKIKPNASRLIRILGLLHFKINKAKIGEKCLLKAASVNRADTITRMHLADYYLKKNQLEKAGRYYLEILTLSVRYHDQAVKLAEKLLVSHCRPLALKIFSKVIVRSKKPNAAREQIIDLCIHRNEFEYPQRLLEEAMKQNPSNYDIMYKAAVVAIENGDYPLALKHLTEVDRHVRGHVEAKYHLAKLYFREGKMVKADEYLSQILRLDPKNDDALALRGQL